jgi:hypothetical protein
MALRVVAIPLFAAICLASPAITSGEQAQKGKGYRPREGGGTQTATRSGGDNRGGGDRSTTSSSRPAERRAETRTPDRDNADQRTARPRDTGGTQTADRSGGDDRRGDRTASTDTNRTEERRRDTRTSDDGNDNQRYAVRRNNNAVVNSPRIITRDVRSNDYRDRAYYRVVRNDWPRININIGSSHRGHYAPMHYDYWARRYYRWSPIRYAPWSLIYGSIGFSNFGYYGGVGPSPFYYGYNGYGYSYGPGIYSPYGGYPTYQYPHVAGAVRLKIRPRDAQVFVDGHYAGLVDDFDGVLQSLKLEAGGHKIEVRMPGFEDLELDVHVQPGRTLTLEEFLRPRP